MQSRGVILRAAALTGALVGLMSVFSMVVRPWYMGWGATAAERVRALPGDALVPGAPAKVTGYAIRGQPVRAEHFRSALAPGAECSRRVSLRPVSRVNTRLILS